MDGKPGTFGTIGRAFGINKGAFAGFFIFAGIINVFLFKLIDESAVLLSISMLFTSLFFALFVIQFQYSSELEEILEPKFQIEWGEDNKFKTLFDADSLEFKKKGRKRFHFNLITDGPLTIKDCKVFPVSLKMNDGATVDLGRYNPIYQNGSIWNGSPLKVNIIEFDETRESISWFPIQDYSLFFDDQKIDSYGHVVNPPMRDLKFRLEKLFVSFRATGKDTLAIEATFKIQLSKDGLLEVKRI